MNLSSPQDGPDFADLIGSQGEQESERADQAAFRDAAALTALPGLMRFMNARVEGMEVIAQKAFEMAEAMVRERACRFPLGARSTGDVCNATGQAFSQIASHGRAMEEATAYDREIRDHILTREQEHSEQVALALEAKQQVSGGDDAPEAPGHA